MAEFKSEGTHEFTSKAPSLPQDFIKSILNSFPYHGISTLLAEWELSWQMLQVLFITIGYLIGP